MSISLIIPVAGRGTRFANKGWSVPKPLIDIGGKTMIERVLKSFQLPISRGKIDQIILISKEEMVGKLAQHLTFLKQYPTDVQYVVAKQSTQGAACSVLLARNVYKGRKILIADCDTAYCPRKVEKFVEYLDQPSISLAVSCFESCDDRFSYVNTTAFPTKIAEKEVISKLAISGLYYFSNSIDFIEAATDSMIYGDRVKGEYYVSNIMNWVANTKMLEVKVFPFDLTDIHFYGTPEQLEQELLKMA